MKEALEEHERARALDPLTPSLTTWIPSLHWFSRDFERAYAEARELVAGVYADEPIANLVLGTSAAHTGRYDEAIEVLERLLRKFPSFPFRVDGQAYALAGRRDEALRVAQEIESNLSPMNAKMLWAYAALEDREQALRWLEYEPRNFSLPGVWAYPATDALRDDPRFQAVFRKMNLAFEPGRLAPVPLPSVPPK